MKGLMTPEMKVRILAISKKPRSEAEEIINITSQQAEMTAERIRRKKLLRKILLVSIFGVIN